MSDSVRLHRQQPTMLPRPWNSPGKNAEGGCHFLLQCMKVESESEVVIKKMHLYEKTIVVVVQSLTKLCPTLCDLMDRSPSSSSVHGIFPGKNIGVGCRFLLQQNLPNPGIELASPALAGRFFTTEPPEMLRPKNHREHKTQK